MTLPVILDVDTGVDDACALLLAARHPALDLRAVTCVGGNAPLADVLRNTLTVLDIAGRTDVAVAGGADRPLLEDPADARHVHGRDGMGDLGLPASTRSPGPGHAVELLRDTLLSAAASGERITVIPLAPLTNIALLLRSYPTVAQGISRILFMGGAAATGNATASAEFNVFHDPEAAAIVVDACADLGIPLTMYGLDVFYAPRVTRVEAAALIAAGDGTGGAISPAGLAGRLIDFQCERFGTDDATIGDAGAVCAAIDPTGLVTAPLPARVELAGRFTRGRTIIDRRDWSGDLTHDPHGQSDAVVEVALDVDGPRFARLWLDSVGSPGTADHDPGRDGSGATQGVGADAGRDADAPATAERDPGQRPAGAHTLPRGAAGPEGSGAAQGVGAAAAVCSAAAPGVADSDLGPLPADGRTPAGETAAGPDGFGGHGRVIVVGSLNVDELVRVDRHPNPGETVLTQGHWRYAGGKGANQAVAAAAAGAETLMVGRVGADPAGAAYRKRLKERGIDITCVTVDENRLTGAAYITVDHVGENRIVVSAGANGEIEQGWPGGFPDVGPGDVVVLQLEIPLTAVRWAAERAHAAGARVVINVAPYAALDPGVLALADPIVANQHEAVQLADSGAGAGSLLVTLGENGAIWDGLHVPAAPVPGGRVVDTTGAGDAFVGALAAALARGADRDEALAAAAAAGAAAVTTEGAQPDAELRTV